MPPKRGEGAAKRLRERYEVGMAMLGIHLELHRKQGATAWARDIGESMATIDRLNAISEKMGGQSYSAIVRMAVKKFRPSQESPRPNPQPQNPR